MSLKEAYQVFYGSTEDFVTEEYIIKNYTDNDLKKRYRELTLENHPDVNHDSSKMSDINSAWDILKKINFNKKRGDSKKSKTVKKEDNKKYNYQELLSMLETAYFYKQYYNELKLIDTTNNYYENIKKCKSLTDLYILRQKFIGFIELNKKDKYIIEKQYYDIRHYASLKSCDNNELYNRLYKYSCNYFDKLNDIDYKLRINNLYNKLKSRNQEFLDKSSYIMNIKNLLIQVVNNSDKLKQLQIFTKLREVATDTLYKMRNSNNVSFQEETYKKYFDFKEDLFKDINYWKNYKYVLTGELIRLDNSELNLDYIERLEKKLTDNKISNDLLYLLLDSKELNRIMSRDFQYNQDNYRNKNKDISKEWKDVLKNMRRYTSEYKNNIEKINHLLTYYKKELPVLKEKTSLKDNKNREEKTITKYYFYKSSAYIKEKKCIELYMEIFLQYYIGYNDKKLPNQIKNDYAIALLDNVSITELDRIYKKFTEHYYDEIMKNYNNSREMFSLENKELFKKLMTQVKECVSLLKKNNIKIPNYILSSNLEKLNQIELYNIYNNLLLLNETDKLIKSSNKNYMTDETRKIIDNGIEKLTYEQLFSLYLRLDDELYASRFKEFKIK